MNIAVLVSGGVDSSVALRLLKDQGHELTAFYLKIWLEDDLSTLGSCPWEEDLAYVRSVCEQADIPLRVISLQDEYWQRVVAYVIAEVRAGRTPNPDVLCNKQIKFGAFFDHLAKNEFDYVATGHYAQVVRNGDSVVLRRAPDVVKDQTYFLAYLDPAQLKKALFPIGHLTKNQVRELAHSYDLPNKDRKDSQGICFLGKIKFSDFIRHHLGHRSGDIIEFETGKVLGSHQGFYYFTLGQRQGSGLSGGPWYVVKKDPVNNFVYVSRSYYADDKKRNRFMIGSCNWLADWKKSSGTQVKLRHGPKLYNCDLTAVSDEVIAVSLHEDDQGIAPGQFAVFYEGDTCLGSGVILD